MFLLPLLLLSSSNGYAQKKKDDKPAAPPKKTETKPTKSKTATPPVQTGTEPATPAAPPKDATTTGQTGTNPPPVVPPKSTVTSVPPAQSGTPSAPAAAPGTSRVASVPPGQPATANVTGAQPSKSIASVPSTPSPKEQSLLLTAPQFNNELTAMLGEKMGLGSPLVLNQKSAYEELSPSDMTDFHPVQLRPVTIQDMQKPLPPGDYSADVLAFCTQASIHQPGQGLPYKLASVEGKQASAISTLIVRGVIHKVSPATINAEAWRIESGLPLSNWPPEDRALMHRLMPEYTARLEVDPFHQKPGVLGSLSPKLDEQRKILSDKTLAAERLPDRLYEPPKDGFGRKLPAEEGTATSPWMKLKHLPGVYARFTVVGGNLQSDNKFEFRITSAALRPTKAAKATSLVSYVTCGSAQIGADVSAGPSLSEVMGMGNPVGQGAMLNIGYPIGRGAQALIPVLPPQPESPAPSPPSSMTVYLGGAGMDGAYIADQVASLQEVGVKNVVAGKYTGGQNWDVFTILWRRGSTDSSWNLNALGVNDDGKSTINFIGYSYGSVIAAQSARYYANAGRKVGSLVLIGCPIDAAFLQELQTLKQQGKINSIVVVNLEQYGDPIYAGMSFYELSDLLVEYGEFGLDATLGGTPETGTGHFYYGLGDNAGKQRRRELAKKLWDNGLR
jgi:pimeloyl-ACP methyl ester carboxylesterase